VQTRRGARITCNKIRGACDEQQRLVFDAGVTACVCAGRAARASASRSPLPPVKTPATPGAVAASSTAAASAGARPAATSSCSGRLMRRSASFDTIAGFYLAGRWPCRDPATIMASLVNAPITLTIDKSTQVM